MLKLSLLGSFQIIQAGSPLQALKTEKMRALLAYLVLENTAPIKLSTLATIFWPKSSPAAGLRSLRQMLNRIIRALDESPQDEFDSDEIIFPILLHPKTAQFNPRSIVWIDVTEFKSLTAECTRHPHLQMSDCPECLERLELAVSIYKGEMLESANFQDLPEFNEWLTVCRAHLTKLMLASLDQLANHCLKKAELASSREERRGFLEKASRYALRAIEIDSQRESAHIQLMKIQAIQGKLQEALELFEIYQSKSKVDLLDQGQEIAQLREQILNREYVVPLLQTSRRANLEPKRPSRLPAVPPLFGRENQLERLKELLFTYRWVTLVGEDGVGKTSLALTAAEALRDKFPDGIWFIPLSPASPGAGPASLDQYTNLQAIHLRLEEALISALGLSRRRSEEEVLIKSIRDKKILIILDGFEELSAGAEFILDLLIDAPKTHVLVTTRQPFYFQAGCILRLEGLATPADDSELDAESYPSLAFFLSCVQRLDPTFAFNPKTLPEAVRICRLTGGLPIALELVAAWTRQYPLEIIASMIQFELDMMTSALPGQTDNSRCLQIIFDNTWTSLLPREQLVLALCALRQREFSFEQAQATAPVTYHDLTVLVENGLVHKIDLNRYKIQDCVREMAAQKLGEMKPEYRVKIHDPHLHLVQREYLPRRMPRHNHTQRVG
jgi:DNA-binding SARP family transcriptional activator